MIKVTIEVPADQIELIVKIASALKDAGVLVMISTGDEKGQAQANGSSGQGAAEVVGTLIAYAPQKPGKKGELALVQLANGEVKNVAVFDRAFTVGEKVAIYKKPSGYSGLKKADPIPF